MCALISGFVPTGIFVPILFSAECSSFMVLHSLMLWMYSWSGGGGRVHSLVSCKSVYGEMRTLSSEPGRLSPRVSAESTLGTLLLISQGAGAMLIINVDTKEITGTSKNSNTFTVKNRDYNTRQIVAEEGVRALTIPGTTVKVQNTAEYFLAPLFSL